MNIFDLAARQQSGSTASTRDGRAFHRIFRIDSVPVKQLRR